MSGPALRQGLDLVEIARVADLLERHPERFASRCFTARELEAAEGLGERRRIEHLAGRFAAKEAAAKALGTGIAEGVGWTDIEVIGGPAGAPALVLHGGAGTRAAALGATDWVVSITHAAGLAAAVVTAVVGSVVAASDGEDAEDAPRA